MINLIAEWLPLFFQPADLFEVRGLNIGRPGRKVAGWFKAADIPNAAGKLAEVANQVCEGGGVYFTPNPVVKDCYRRAANTFTPVYRDKKTNLARPQLTGDAEVIERRWLLIDVDPVRGEKGQSATDAEKAAALAVTESVRGYLDTKGLASPIVVDSGNGYHLYYRLREVLPGGPADSESDKLAACLRCLAAKFDTPAAKIDTLVYNASRIMKVPGTFARKGADTHSRPHRQCHVIEVPTCPPS